MHITAYETEETAEVPRWAWLWLPPSLLLVDLLFRVADRPLYARLWLSEDGLMENATALLLLPGIVAGVLILRRANRLPSRIAQAWMGLTLLGAIYFAGEEVSWGQHWFGWGTPELIARLNDQDETNLHNMSSWFDQKPRLLLELWVLGGGVFYPLWLGWRGRADVPGHWAYWIMPTRPLLPTAALAILVKVPERLQDWFGVPSLPPLDMQYSETQEFYFAIFLSLYLSSVYLRLRSPKAETSA